MSFVGLAVAMGLLSLLTPCVLPMIPVTLAYFGGSKEHPGSTRTLAALAHALGIVGAFTLLGVAVATFLGASGVVRLAANPWLNLAIAALFIAFALNLLGVLEITLPQRVLARAATVGTSRGRHATGALLMGGAFAVTSFTCTVPFVGTLLVLATQGSWRWPLAGMSAYGAAFALPFFVLAFAPALVSKLIRSGPWVVTLRRAAGVAELALAVKFLSNADLVLGTNLLTRDVVIVTWILASFAIAGLAAAHILPQGAERPKPRAVPALMIALSALAFATWLGRGLRDERLGELEAYLPPHVNAEGAPVFAANEPVWIMNDLDAALARARMEGKAVLVDFSGYTCTNCRWMEGNMFPRSDVVPELDRYIRVRLYTDGIGEPSRSNQRFQLERYGTIAIPYYAVIDPNGTTRSTFAGMTRDPNAFASFLAGTPKGGMTRAP